MSETDVLITSTGYRYSIQTRIQSRKLPQGNTRSWSAVFILINAAMGAGLLTFPYAFFLTGGWQWGLVVQLLMLPFIFGSLMILAYCAELKQVGTYEEIMEHMFSPHLRSLTEVLVFIYCFGGCVTYLVIIGDQIQDITNAFTYHNQTLSDYWWASRQLTVTVSALLLIYPWLYFKNIGVLSYTSFLGFLCCIYIAGIVLVKYFLPAFKCSGSRHLPEPFKTSWATAFNSVPFMCFALQCHIAAIPIFASLKTRTLKNFLAIICAGVFICITVYSVTGVFGLLTFSGTRDEPINSDILRNYCPTDIAISIARGTLVLSLITSYPIISFCGSYHYSPVHEHPHKSIIPAFRGLLLSSTWPWKALLKSIAVCSRVAFESALVRVHGSLSRSKRKIEEESSQTTTNTAHCLISPETIRRIVISNIWFIVSLGLALFVPQVKYVMSPVGCMDGAFIFVFPGICILKLGLDSHFKSQIVNVVLVIVSCIQIVTGVFVLGDALVYDIMEDIKQLRRVHV